MLFEITEGEPIHGAGFKKAVVKKMVKTYRGKYENLEVLKSAHFTVDEVITLFIKNGILPEEVKKMIKIPNQGAKKYGVKIYMGTHTDHITYGDRGDYNGMDTTIMCNTIVYSKNHYLDMLDDKKSDEIKYIAIPISKKDGEINPGDGLDQATICPPDCPKEECPSPNPSDGYDLGND